MTFARRHAAVSAPPTSLPTRQNRTAHIPGEHRTRARRRAVKLRVTCCQYSSRDGKAEKYPVSCTIWSSWKMLHMGMTSISLRGCSHKVEANCQARRAKQARGVQTGAGVSAVRACMMCLRSGARPLEGLERVTHRERTTSELSKKSAHCKLPPRFKITDKPTPM